MNHVLKIDAPNTEATEQIAETIGRHLRGGEVIELVSDLGGGKTTFTRGLARGMGSSDHVSSPTFTISQIYGGAHLTMHHFDFYRLPEAGLIQHELQDVLDDPKNVTVIEWSAVVAQVLPKKRLTIHLQATGEDSRQLELHYPPELSYLVEKL